MKIGYDIAKFKKTLTERGLSFDYVVYLDWDSALVWIDDRLEYGETRYCALAMNEKLFAVVFALRGELVWVISLRRANKREERKYHEKRQP